MSDTDDDLPFSQACENNKRPILSVLQRHLVGSVRVLEIGSGTGQHAVFFARELPEVVWQTSDRDEYLDIVRARVGRAKVPNLLPPLDLDVERQPWPAIECDAVFSANTSHIMSWSAVESFVAGVGALLAEGGLFLLYGPFNYSGLFTSPSNAAFDGSLRRRDPRSGLRNFEDVDVLAQRAGLRLLEDNAMPANNRLLVWRRVA